MSMSLAYISHPDCQLHDTGPHHPERPERLGAINDRLIATGLDMALHHYNAPLVERELLEAVHDPDYVARIYETAAVQGLIWMEGETAIGKHTLGAALRAAGAAVMGVDLVMSGEAGKVFCGIRPPGHHAERDKAMGFCIFNNVAIAAHHALASHGLERVAIVDFDVHHCNGTEDIFAGDERVLLCSTFQHPFYPHTGHDCRAANVVNVPLAAGADGAVFRQAVEQHWLPRLASFAPQLILISAGFDAHQADYMAQLNLVDSDYAWVTRRLSEQADASADGRIVSSLEGGYELHALARSVEAHLKAFFGEL
jgi:acetoin utilization deacetylase AcuC-like enzyme